jgi:hypothetical protein
VESGKGLRPPKVEGSNPSPGIFSQRLLSVKAPRLFVHIPFLTIDSYYSFISTMMIVLFVVAIIVVFVYEYEALRRSKT